MKRTIMIIITLLTLITGTANAEIIGTTVSVSAWANFIGADECENIPNSSWMYSSWSASSLSTAAGGDQYTQGVVAMSNLRSRSADLFINTVFALKYTCNQCGSAYMDYYAAVTTLATLTFNSPTPTTLSIQYLFSSDSFFDNGYGLRDSDGNVSVGKHYYEEGGAYSDSGLLRVTLPPGEDIFYIETFNSNVEGMATGNSLIGTVSFRIVPEPSIMILLGISMVSLVGLKRKWKE